MMVSRLPLRVRLVSPGPRPAGPCRVSGARHGHGYRYSAVTSSNRASKRTLSRTHRWPYAAWGPETRTV